MQLVCRPSSERAIAVLQREVAEALRLITTIRQRTELRHEDDFGSVLVDPFQLDELGFSATSVSVLVAADGLALAFSDDDLTRLAVGDLDWAARNLRRLVADIHVVDEERAEVGDDGQVRHLWLGVLREVARDSDVQMTEPPSPAPALLRGAELLDAQQRAVLDASAAMDLLINAGAGSGKTHTLSLRIARLVADGSIGPDRFLALTFSRAAREQIQGRLQALASAEHPLLSRTDVRTIHSLGRRILQLAAQAGKTRVRPGFQLVAEGWRRVPDGRGVSARMPFIEAYDELFDAVDDGRSERARLILYPAAIDALRMGHPAVGVITKPDDLPIAEALTILDPRTGALSELNPDHVARVWRRYEHILESRNEVDFPGMVSEALQAVRAHPAVARVAGAPYEHIFVDEFQDTSRAQSDLLFELAAQGSILTCVGDGDQTIFSFAGAAADGMTAFRERLKARTGREAAILPLEFNYRSTPPIVAIAESIVQRNHNRLARSMHAARGDVAAIPLTAARAPLRYAAPWVALQVRSLLDGGTEPAAIAVLFRKEAPNSPQESKVLQHLEKLSVPVTTDPQSREGVRVLSIHQAKGSEFGYVFCLQLGPDHFPDRRGDPEEERRLLYVAITRAKEAFSLAGEPGADPDLFDEFESGEPSPIQLTIENLGDVLVLDTVDATTLGLTDMGDLDVTMLDWDDPIDGRKRGG